MNRKLKVLIIDDSLLDSEMIVRSLRHSGYQMEYQQVDNAVALGIALEQNAWDLIVADHSMPGFSAPEALAIVQNKKLPTPFILVSGEIETDLAVYLMKSGACDYVRKTDLARLALSVDKELEKVDNMRRQETMRQALEESEERLRRAELIAGLGNWTLYLEGWRLYASEGAGQLFGLEGGRWEAREVEKSILPEYRQDMRHSLAYMMLYNRPYDLQCRIRRINDGAILDVHATAEYDRERGVVFGVVRDITEQVKMRQERAELQEHIAVASKLKSLGVMSSGIVHEIAQPLNAITILAESSLHLHRKGLLEKGMGVAETMERILNQVERVNRIAAHIRSFANVDLVSETGPCDVNQAVKEALEVLGQQLRDHGIKLDCALENDLPLVLATEHSLEEVVVNLLGNSLHALDVSGRIRKSISCRTWSQNSRVFLEVADNATGIPDEDREAIFEPFYSTKGGGEGMGLGLAIVQAIVNGCRGRVVAFNNKEGGATFRVEIPPMQAGIMRG